MDGVRYQLIKKFCELTGNMERAVRRKIEDGIWREGAAMRGFPLPPGDLEVSVQRAGALNTITANIQNK
jgi:hypothetical protein